MCRNKGCAGIDNMSVSDMKPYLVEHWSLVKDDLLTDRYKPQDLKHTEIPKPDGGLRQLSIPTVLDRLIQQAMLQIVQDITDHEFSDSSYGFRPGRSAHTAIKQVQVYQQEGYEYVVDIDLARYFDTVSHDRLMSKLYKRIKDQRVLNLIRGYLNKGVKLQGERVPQGSPLSPWLSRLHDKNLSI
mgnify:CR=1 FL=1